MKKLLIITSLLESSLGILLILMPAVILKLIFEIEADETIITLTYLTGIVFFCLGLACYPFNEINEKKEISRMTGAVRGMFAYNFLATLFFGYLKIKGTYDGVLLLPTFILHGLISVYFIILIFRLRN